MEMKFNSSPISEKRQSSVRDAKVDLVDEHSSRDEQIQRLIRENYSLSEEISLLRKEVNELKTAFIELLQIETFDSEESSEFDKYNAFIEECKKKVPEEEYEKGINPEQ